MKKVLSLLVLVIIAMGSFGFASSGEVATNNANDYSGEHIQESKLSTHGEILKELGIINGTKNGLEEYSELTREELVTVMIALTDTSGVQLPSTPHFTDVPREHWAYEVIAQAYELGITEGISEGIFGLGKKVDKAQALMFTCNLLGPPLNWDTIEAEANKAYGLDVIFDNDTFLRCDFFELINKALLYKTVDGHRLLETYVSEKDFNGVIEDKIKNRIEHDYYVKAQETANFLAASWITNTPLVGMKTVFGTVYERNLLDTVKDQNLYRVTGNEMVRWINDPGNTKEIALTSEFEYVQRSIYQGSTTDPIQKTISLNYNIDAPEDALISVTSSKYGDYSDKPWIIEFYATKNKNIYVVASRHGEFKLQKIFILDGRSSELEITVYTASNVAPARLISDTGAIRAGVSISPDFQVKVGDIMVGISHVINKDDDKKYIQNILKEEYSPTTPEKLVAFVSNSTEADTIIGSYHSIRRFIAGANTYKVVADNQLFYDLNAVDQTITWVEVDGDEGIFKDRLNQIECYVNSDQSVYLLTFKYSVRDTDGTRDGAFIFDRSENEFKTLVVMSGVISDLILD